MGWGLRHGPAAQPPFVPIPTHPTEPLVWVSACPDIHLVGEGVTVVTRTPPPSPPVAAAPRGVPAPGVPPWWCPQPHGAGETPLAVPPLISAMQGAGGTRLPQRRVPHRGGEEDGDRWQAVGTKPSAPCCPHGAQLASGRCPSPRGAAGRKTASSRPLARREQGWAAGVSCCQRGLGGEDAAPIPPRSRGSTGADFRAGGWRGDASHGPQGGGCATPP